MKNKLIIVLTLVLVCLIFFSAENLAASMGLSISKTSGFVGDNFTVTISGINGRINVTGNSNVTLNLSGSQWVDGSLTITGTAKAEGTGTITITPVDVTTNAAEPEEVTTPRSVSIKISKKETPAPTPVPTPVPTQAPTQAPTTKKNNTTTNKVTPTPENKYEEDQGTISEFGLTSLYLYAINENNEKTEIGLSPIFDINTSEYTCEVESNINNVELIYEANEYKDFVKVTGLENGLNPGENIVKISLNDNNGQEKIYNIKINKKEADIEKNEEEEAVQEKSGDTNEKVIVKMPIIAFVFLELGVIILTVTAVLFILKYKIKKGKRRK